MFLQSLVRKAGVGQGMEGVESLYSTLQDHVLGSAPGSKRNPEPPESFLQRDVAWGRSYREKSVDCAISMGVAVCCEDGASVTARLSLCLTFHPASPLSQGIAKSLLPSG